jgi:hypothetical protein
MYFYFAISDLSHEWDEEQGRNLILLNVTNDLGVEVL